MTYEKPIAEILEGRPDDSKANVRLIAAAPDLLEACEAALKAFVDWNFFGPDRNALIAAIKKATDVPESTWDTPRDLPPNYESLRETIERIRVWAARGMEEPDRKVLYAIVRVCDETLRGEQ